MLKDREELEGKLYKMLHKESANKQRISDYIQSLIVSGISEKNAGEMVLLIKPLNIYDDRSLFKLASILMSTKDVHSYFTPNEVKEYGKTSKTKGKNVFPIKWKMIRIDEHQFIGKITVEELMRLRDLQLLNYNPNTQRPMTGKVFQDNIIYVPTINNRAIKEIEESYYNKSYIPNTLTLNIPIDDTYEYDEDEGELLVNRLDHFDILDGYHRFRAMSDIYNLDSSFDYPMELRVVSFTDEEARQFIWQEDQKTKMKKVDSDSFNQNNYANQLIQELNRFSPVLKGKFNAEYIDPALAGRMLDITFFFGANNKKTRKELIEIRGYIEQTFRDYEGIYDNDLLERKWEPRFIVRFFYSMWKAQEIGFDKMNQLIIDIDKILSEQNPKSQLLASFTRKDLTKLEKNVKEVLDYV